MRQEEWTLWRLQRWIAECSVGGVMGEVRMRAVRDLADLRETELGEYSRSRGSASRLMRTSVEGEPGSGGIGGVRLRSGLESSEKVIHHERPIARGGVLDWKGDEVHVKLCSLEGSMHHARCVGRSRVRCKRRLHIWAGKRRQHRQRSTQR
ncbi:hypothetical protein BOTBODRAFT_231974 [Botryobasidium botryosum FD-172 SS1]|uniref:Uncharacterized protein n=1 Tax=Botryobasidium botryosum (strain FD-172 SS1) TaxID=930990 RepID=A0A067LUY1_BOTB1|nr:hypothetical protein BOTBODRAFT_231974 [Botryobasidium botryosum FD-172 SS1]